MRVKRRIFSGAVCEQIVYTVGDGTRDVKGSKPRVRFRTEEERERHRVEISRRRHIQRFNATFSPASLYSTLTLDDENEVHTFVEAKRLRESFVKRLRYRYPNAVIGIYMGRGKRTHRIHFHMVSNGIPEETIRECWGLGEVLRIEHLREHNRDKEGRDVGRDYTGLANYLFNHWTPEQGGHRWRATRNWREPEAEAARECKASYLVDRPPRAPKGYIFYESRKTDYGFLYFKYIVDPKRAPR